MATTTRPVLVIGGGPAGLTAAFVLARSGVPVTVLEQDRQVGGLARTVEYRGFRFDIGGHRFFTKIPAVQRLWREMLGPDLLRRRRKSRIYYRGSFFDYPLRADSALRTLGLFEAARVIASYVRRQARPVRPEASFEDWVRNRFGDRLYRMFFQSYTEKVWGIPCDRIGAQWAAQRIRGLSLWTAARSMLPGSLNGRDRLKTLIDEFEYPRLGPGMMWDAFASRIHDLGGRVVLAARVTRLDHQDGRITAVSFEHEGRHRSVEPEAVLSTAPLRTLIHMLRPAIDDRVVASADRLRYRDFLTIGLIVRGANLFDDQWIYVHDPDVRVGRIQNFANWSPYMVPEAGKSGLGLEYFCTEGDDLWTMTDADLIALGTRELATIGLCDRSDVLAGIVIRMPKAYPVYDDDFADAVDTVRAALTSFANLQTLGRNGLHKYNNQDHSMVTALLAAANVLDQKGRDVWTVNQDDAYHEEISPATLQSQLDLLESTQPLVPARTTLLSPDPSLPDQLAP